MLEHFTRNLKHFAQKFEHLAKNLKLVARYLIDFTRNIEHFAQDRIPSNSADNQFVFEKLIFFFWRTWDNTARFEGKNEFWGREGRVILCIIYLG